MTRHNAQLVNWGAWLLTADAALYGLFYGALGIVFPAFGDGQIAPLAHVSLDQFTADPLHGVWLREVVSISLTRLALAAIVIIVAFGAARAGQLWAYLVSLIYGALLMREMFNELQTGLSPIFWTGAFFAALWALSFALGLAGMGRVRVAS